MNDVTPTTTTDERNWAVIAHLSALAGLVTAGIGSVIGPLVVWLIKKDAMPFVNDQGREALNFQITMLICGAISGALILAAIGIPLLLAVYIFDLVCIVIAAVKASEGVAYRYPLNFRFIK
jgi:uncharacterized protein